MDGLRFGVPTCQMFRVINDYSVVHIDLHLPPKHFV